MVKKLIKELTKASAHILTKRNPAVRTAKNIIERKTAFQQWLKAKRKKDLPKGADLTDVFKGKNIKNPKTFLKERKKVVGEMTKKKGVMKIGIKKAAKPDKTLVKAREETLRKSPKGSMTRKLKKGHEEEMKARQELKKYGRGFRKGGTVRRKPNKDRYDKGGAVKKRVGQVVQKVKRVAGHLKKVMEEPKKVTYLPAKKMHKGGAVRRYRVGGPVDLRKSVGRTPGIGARQMPDVFQMQTKPIVVRGGLKKWMEGKFGKGAEEAESKAKKEKDRGAVGIEMSDAHGVLDLAKELEPGKKVDQDAINRAQDIYNSARESKRMERQAQERPKMRMEQELEEDTGRLKKQFKELAPPVERKGLGEHLIPYHQSPTPTPPVVKPDVPQQEEQDPFIIDPTDERIEQMKPPRTRRLAEGGSISSKPKHRGWGKAIKGTKFKGTF